MEEPAPPGRPPPATWRSLLRPKPTRQTDRGGRGGRLTRLRFKVFQVYFVLIFIYVLVPAHHHNGKLKLKDKNGNETPSSVPDVGIMHTPAHLRPGGPGYFTRPDPGAARRATPQGPGRAHLLKLLLLDVQQALNPLHDFSEMLALRTGGTGQDRTLIHGPHHDSPLPARRGRKSALTLFNQKMTRGFKF